LGNGLLDGFQDELSGRAASAGRRFVESAMKVAGQVDGGADRIGFHPLIIK